ncbi:MAG: DUF4835 family protein [Flavobacteriaceae bacterium]|nr:DUF4835 family protein [Bacteroidia bacterium]NNL15767.1 DUF4835 family protein [Flavobacteriaceae bacterium]
MRKFVLVVFLFFSVNMFSQELTCDIIVNAQQTGNENLPVFKTLEKQLREFINNTKWTDKTFMPQERINCSMVINVTANNNDSFVASLQIQSSRPVFNSTFVTPVYNYNDPNFSFKYVEYQDLIFNKNQFVSNLVSVISFHIYMILGIDADTFALNGGEKYFEQAEVILNYSQQENFKGWNLADGRQTRYILISNLLSPTYKEYRSALYSYHFEGLDKMHENPKLAKEKIANSFNQLKLMNSRRPNSFLLRTFFDAKSDEIEQIFTGGPSINITETIETLNKIAPMHSSKWRNITF